jgi:hypothetical protein
LVKVLLVLAAINIAALLRVRIVLEAVVVVVVVLVGEMGTNLRTKKLEHVELMAAAEVVQRPTARTTPVLVV